jgi:hypothetical protein
MQYKKQGSNKASGGNGSILATLAPHLVAMKAFLIGFSFGSELFLVIGMLENAPVLAATMTIFRLSHAAIGAALVSVLFGSSGLSTWLETTDMMRKATALPSLICEDFCRANMPLLSGVVLLSMGDCFMVQFLPWKASSVYAESQGFASLSLQRWCLGTDTVQATVSVLCQIIFLATRAGKDEPNTSGQAKALFAMNITFTVLGLVWGLTTLYTKESLLSRLESEEDGGGNKNRGVGRSAGKAKIGLVVVNSGEGEEEEEREFSFADFYGNDDHDGDAAEMANVINPMMAAAAAAAGSSIRVGHDDRTEALKFSEDSTALELRLHEVLTENSQLEMKKLKLKEDNARLENEQMTTTTIEL